MGLKHEKVAGLIRELAASFIVKHSGTASLITVTRADVAKDFRKSTIYITVLPENKEDAALDFLKRKRSDFRESVMKETNLRIIPFFDFEIDKGEKSRQRLDEISRDN